MGTNYYYRMTKFRRLGWDVEEKQIGKKSAGWQFCFRAHKGEWQAISWALFVRFIEKGIER